MPTTIKVIHTQDFIRATPDGALDFRASRNLLKALVTESASATEYQVLVDTRRADVRLSTAEIFNLAVAVSEEPGLARGRRLAFLVPSEEKHDADFFENVSRNRGADLKAFTDFEAALTWLIMSQQP